ncbi:hypothetical protein CLOSTMETH_02484 [[Clostridium] methylpentosum DSM 5476]|uniref:Uncharacterized protein n=1 Tax=[Clostridium] methylpentosum DSM 5476 TaxID=537013 RepID=C0EF44_9FIRM|nr:hypothetical protein CLOSTMETH_02484 [[Clostridium] methylpentosum DSM 5476]
MFFTSQFYIIAQNKSLVIKWRVSLNKRNLHLDRDTSSLVTPGVQPFHLTAIVIYTG